MASTVQTERLGVAAVEKIAAAAGWFFRELPNPDEGVDGHLEAATDDGRPNGRLLGTQIKSGSSYFRSATDDGWWYSVAPRHLKYWSRYSLPVILILYDPSSDRAYWQVVRGENLTPTENGARLFVPRNHAFGAPALPELTAIANEGLPDDPAALEAVLTERRAEADLGWIQLIDSGNRLFVEAEEWVNKTSGRGSLRLVVADKNGIERIEHEWPWVFLPGASYADELPRVFPWADLRIDEDLYREETYAEFLNECGMWDPEDGVYIEHEDFGEWFESQFTGELRPYGEAGGGEVALWRLELTLNELGAELLRKDREAEYEDAWLTVSIERRLEEERATGNYEGFVGDMPVGKTLEFVAFVTDDDLVTLGADELLWTTEASRPKAAALILEHARGHAPTQAQVDAFLSRFGEVFEDDGQGWSLSFAEVERWLKDLSLGGRQR